MSESPDMRPEWAGQIGKRHPGGVKLNVAVRMAGCTHDGIDYQIRGVVDVPSLPRGWDETQLLARTLARDVDALKGKTYEYTCLDWRPAKGGRGIHVHSWRDCEATVITDDDLVGPIKAFEPPDFEKHTYIASPEKHAEWGREYEANRYGRLESRRELHQRYQDILVNLTILKLSGQLGVSEDERWHRLFHHVVVEMNVRGEPPTQAANFDPRVEEARPFFDGEMCRKAANVSAERGTYLDVMVKYGKREHMEELMRGELYMNSASNYNRSVHNQAVRDNELEVDFKGGVVRALHPTLYYNKGNQPKPSINGFRPVFDCPDLKRDEYATTTVQSHGDYWMFCAANALDPRFFLDFDADCCVIIRRRPFVERLGKTPPQLPNATMSIGSIQYVDPLGAQSSSWPVKSSDIPMTKLFRYAYQREVRFICVPNEPTERLEPRLRQLGPLTDIAELVPIPRASS
ncbi:MAG: hypothetical protein OXH15_16320 [Gammaproteobacteria bacterium]|nr:hypothetical protein [Gammaproteobacteria bacterium]